MPEFLIGVSLGVDRNTSALAIIQRQVSTAAKYVVRTLERFPSGESPETVSSRVFDLGLDDDLRDEKVRYYVDTSATGAAALRPFDAKKMLPQGVIVTEGGAMKRVRREVRIPRRDLLTMVKMVVESGRLNISGELDDAVLLRDQLYACSIEPPKGASAWRAGRDEDYLMAVAVPVWYAEQFLPTKKDSFGPMPKGRPAADLW